jgi:hypothetical protein
VERLFFSMDRRGVAGGILKLLRRTNILRRYLPA